MPTEGENSEKTLALAGLPDTACSPSSRALVCCFCGKAWSYDGASPKNELMKEAVDHEKACVKNPYIARIYLLECALRDIEIWAEHDPAYFADRSEAMARIASKAKYALEND